MEKELQQKIEIFLKNRKIELFDYYKKVIEKYKKAKVYHRENEQLCIDGKLNYFNTSSFAKVHGISVSELVKISHMDISGLEEYTDNQIKKVRKRLSDLFLSISFDIISFDLDINLNGTIITNQDKRTYYLIQVEGEIQKPHCRFLQKRFSLKTGKMIKRKDWID